MSPLRGDVLGLAFLLALPLLALAWRGDLDLDELTSRLPWCLAAAWAAVALLRWAARPPATQEDDAGADAAPGGPQPAEGSAPAV